MIDFGNPENGPDWVAEQAWEVCGCTPHVDYDTWETRDGTRIAVASMTLGHIRNALRLQARKGHPYHPGLLDEWEARTGTDWEEA